MFQFIDLEEKQLRQLSDAAAAWANYVRAKAEAAEVRGSMRWKTVDGRVYLIRVSPSGGETSLGPQDDRTQAIYAAFHSRKAPAEARLKAMKATLEEQRRLNRAYRVGRTPAVVVRSLAALDQAGLSDQFLTVGTHALYAYETAAGVRVEAGALATMDLDLLFEAAKFRAYSSRLKRSDARSLIEVFRRADPTFKVKSDQLQTAVNDPGFEIDIIRRYATAGDPHPLRMSDDENDFWAVQADQGEQLASSRKFEHLVIAPTGEMAMMRTLHPLDFVRLKLQLAQRPGRDPHKAPKDRLQARVVQELWDGYLQHLERPEEPPRREHPQSERR
ncbi:GSU2403 family nucleotidyltransferase fold protein [Ramlibacter sp. AN1133]|uniref:GSU2403 family nucleotidyltransferase fold protein n=1 Tax=Ramlibacter sp. AN1133 TaxID=3133429 RepID=UPI0030BD6F37